MATTTLPADPSGVRAETHDEANGSTPAVSPRDLVQFRAGDALAEELTNRLDCGLSPSLTLKRAGERYFALLAVARETLPFTDEEIALVHRAAWDTPGGLGGTVPRLLWAAVSDAFARHPEFADEAPDVAVDLLVAKLRDLGDAELYALVDRVECAPHPALAPG